MYYFQCSAFIPWRYRMKGIASLVYAAMKISPFSICNSKKECILEKHKQFNNRQVQAWNFKKKTVINICCNAKLLFEKKITNNHFGCRFLSTCDGILSHKERFMLYVKRVYSNEYQISITTTCSIYIALVSFETYFEIKWKQWYAYELSAYLCKLSSI